MKKKIKLIVLIVFGMFIFTGCGKSFCNIEDTYNIQEAIREKNYDVWYEEASIKFGTNELEIQNYINQKVSDEYAKDPQACLTNEEIVTQNGATINKKTWKDAFKLSKNGNGISLFEGLFVFPIGAMIMFFTKLLGGNAVAKFFALFFVTIIIRLLSFLLTFKSSTQGNKLQEIQPELMKLQAKLNESSTKEEKQAVSMEMMQVYKKNKINPLGALIMPFVSFPIFIGVWQAVKNTHILSVGKVMGIQMGLTLKDQIFSGNWYAVLVFILMALFQFVSMKVGQWLIKHDAKKNGKPVTKPSQQMNMTSNIMLIMILITGFTLSGSIVFYWIFGAVFGIVQTVITYYINKNVKIKKEKIKNDPQSVFK